MTRAIMLSSVVVACFAVSVLSSCASGERGGNLKPPVYDLPKCPVAEEPVPVEELGGKARWDCDLTGNSVVFPDGHVASLGGTVTTEGIDSHGGARRVTYQTVNLGQYGYVAGRIGDEDPHPMWWGTKDGRTEWAKLGGPRRLTIEGQSL